MAARTAGPADRAKFAASGTGHWPCRGCAAADTARPGTAARPTGATADAAPLPRASTDGSIDKPPRRTPVQVFY